MCCMFSIVESLKGVCIQQRGSVHMCWVCGLASQAESAQTLEGVREGEDSGLEETTVSDSR